MVFSLSVNFVRSTTKVEFSRVYKHIAQGLEDLLDISEKAALIGVFRDQSYHGVEGHQHTGQADSVGDVVDQEHIYILDCIREALRYKKQKHGGNGEGDAHSEEPDPGLSHLGVCLVHDPAHDQVGNTIKDL